MIHKSLIWGVRPKKEGKHRGGSRKIGNSPSKKKGARHAKGTLEGGGVRAIGDEKGSLHAVLVRQKKAGRGKHAEGCDGRARIKHAPLKS